MDQQNRIYKYDRKNEIIQEDFLHVERSQF